MRKKFLKTVSSTLAGVMLLTCMLSASAAGEAPVVATKQNAEQILVDFGMDKEQAAEMDAEEKMNMAKAILRNPETVQMTDSVVNFDRIEELETVVNASDEMMIDAGLSKDEITYYRNQAEELNEMSDQELAKNYHADATEVKMIRMALEPDESYIQNKKELKNTVTSSSTISSSTLTLSLSSYDNSSSTCKKVSYRVSGYYRWKSEPLFKSEDQLGIAWGGGLAQMDHKRVYNRSMGRTTTLTVNGTGSSNTAVSRIEQTTNAGLIHYFALQIGTGSNARPVEKYMSGYTHVTIYQTKRDGKSADLIGKYAHKILTITGAGLSVSKSGASASFSTSSGYDYGTPNSLNIVY